jgi:hypothetical protein
LTLYLARAIHAFNPPPPPLPSRKPFEKSTSILETENQDFNSSDNAGISVGGLLLDEPKSEKPDVSNTGQITASLDEFPSGEPKPESLNVPKLDRVKLLNDIFDVGVEPESHEKASYEAYLTSRRAIVQTLDISYQYSKFARKIVRNFRRGLYYYNVDFHVGTIPEYLSSRLSSTPEPFLEHAILDLPGPQEHMELISQALKPGGYLIVFCPSITQIVECAKVVREKNLPYALESTLELGMGAGVGGREWDIRLVKPRAKQRAEAEAVKVEERTDAVLESDLADDELSSSTARDSRDSDFVTICRPKVGGKVSGGGFLGLWRRRSEKSSLQHPKVDLGPT